MEVVLGQFLFVPLNQVDVLRQVHRFDSCWLKKSQEKVLESCRQHIQIDTINAESKMRLESKLYLAGGGGGGACDVRLADGYMDWPGGGGGLRDW